MNTKMIYLQLYNEIQLLIMKSISSLKRKDSENTHTHKKEIISLD